MNHAIRPLRAAWLCLACLLLPGCTTSVSVEGSLPVPVVAKLPVRAGIYLSEAFRTYRYQEDVDATNRVDIELGRQNTLFFTRLFEAMFAETVFLDEPAAEEGSVDLIVAPQIDQFGFLSPSITGLNFYAASIHYKMNLLTPGGQPIVSWVVVGYGKSPSALFGAAQALNDATMTAIRDGGARIATGTAAQEEFSLWLAEQGLARGQEASNAARNQP